MNSAEDLAESGWRRRDRMALVEENLRMLSTQEERVLRLLFGIGAAAHSRDELGQRLGISLRWLRQIEHRALRHLRSVAVSDSTAATTERRRKSNA